MPALSSHPLSAAAISEGRRIRVTPIAPETEPKSSPRPRAPLLAGRYSITRYFDRGGTSKVYLGRDEISGTDVVIKILTDKAARCSVLRGHFLVGSRAALSVNHPNVVKVLAVREPDPGTPYLVMEVLRGELMADVLGRKPQLPPRAVLSLAEQVANGLSALHAAGIVHCDIKPDNLFLCEAPGTAKIVKILDFGLAEVEGHERFGDPQAVRGTAQFMAPEQVLGDDIDPRADVYALGVVMFRMLTGQLPFDLKLSATLLRHQLFSPTPPPSWLCEDLDPAIDRIVQKAMSKNPDNRYGSALEMSDDLERALTGRVVLAQPNPANDVYVPRSKQAENAAVVLGR